MKGDGNRVPKSRKQRRIIMNYQERLNTRFDQLRAELAHINEQLCVANPEEWKLLCAREVEVRLELVEMQKYISEL